MPKLRHSRGFPDFRYYTETELGSSIAPSGASLIGVEDTGGYFVGTDVESILQEIPGTILPGALPIGTVLMYNGTGIANVGQEQKILATMQQTQSLCLDGKCAMEMPQPQIY